jgi:lysozyme
MKPRHQVSRAAIELIKSFEGYRRKAARLADGRWTIGYGHTLTAREGAQVSEKDAEALLLYDLIAISHAVNEWTYAPLTQNQFDALCAFAFNIGADNFRRSSVLRRLNEGQHLQAACAMDLWRKADFEGERIVIDALVRRRAAEKNLFLTPTDGWVPAPSPILRPNVDMDASGAVPSERPAELRPAMHGAVAVVERVDAPVAPVVPEEELSPTQAAAANVTARLASLFPEPAAPTPAPVPVAAPAPVAAAPAAVPPAPKLTKPAEAAPVRAAPVAAAPVAVAPVSVAPELVADRPPLPPPAWPVKLGEEAFTLTPPVEQDFETPAAPPPVEAPFPANETAPGLFDPREVANDQLAQPAAPPEDRPRILIDDTLEYEGSFDAIAPEQPRFPLLPFLGLGALGLAFFAGGLFWSVSVKDTGTGPSVAAMVGWLACLAGVGFFCTAAYLMLGRLGRVEPADQDEGADQAS